jgi:hypothetical protein
MNYKLGFCVDEINNFEKNHTLVTAISLESVQRRDLSLGI